ncbi:MAG: hypothetical protein QM696_07840 [Steroidobacteraceae bacterium]
MYPVYMGIAAGTLREDDFAAWLHPRVTPHMPRGVHEKRGRYAASFSGIGRAMA